MSIIKKIIPFLDFILIPFVLIASLLMKLIRRIGIEKMKFSKNIFNFTGIYPIRDHYYEPLYNPKYLQKSLTNDRVLNGIDLNLDGQLTLLSKFNYNIELSAIPVEKGEKLTYYYHNGAFDPGDAEIFYSMIRYFKPGKIIEIGCGNSTLMANIAIEQNIKENKDYTCEHICIEPFEMDWLKDLDINLIRDKVENVNSTVFQSLNKNDILFIDSSHVIRPQGDVLFEYLEILPILKSGVLIHIHDIFTPRDYPEAWIIEQVRLWNEQYLLEAFLSYNSAFKIIMALNFLKHNYPEELFKKCPILKNENDRDPGSFWIVKN